MEESATLPPKETME